MYICIPLRGLVVAFDLVSLSRNLPIPVPPHCVPQQCYPSLLMQTYVVMILPLFGAECKSTVVGDGQTI